MALNTNISLTGETRAINALTDQQQRQAVEARRRQTDAEALAAIQGNNVVPTTHYINSGSQPIGYGGEAGPSNDPRTLEQRSIDFRAAQDQAGNAQVVNPQGLDPLQSVYNQSGLDQYIPDNNAVGNGGMSSATIYAMQRQGLIPNQGGIQYQDEAVLNAPAGLISDFVNRSPQELIDNKMVPVGVGGVQQQITGRSNDPGTRGTYRSMTQEEVLTQIERLQSNSTKLGRTLSAASAGNDSTLATALLEEFGENGFSTDENGALTIRPEVAMNLLLAHYTALEESSYASFSDDEKLNHSRYKAEYGENHPDLYMAKQGRSARTPELEVLESGIGKAFESNGNVKWGKKYNGDIIGQGVLRAVQAFDDSGMSDISTTYMSATEQGYYPGGDMQPVHGMSQDRSLKRDLLAKTRGIRDLLNPGRRNNVRVTKRSLPRPVDSEIQGARQGGSDPIRTQAQNILEDVPMRIDQGFLRILNRTYMANPELNSFWVNGSMKVKETSFNIVNQQDAYINQASVDGVYYSDQHYRSSGRKGDDNLLMADFKVVRSLSIAADTKGMIHFGKASEVDFKVGVMFLLGKDSKLEKTNVKEFNQMFSDPASQGRMFASALDALSQENVTEEQVEALVQKNFSGENLKAFNDIFMQEGTDGVQALRAVNDYYRAKDRQGSTGFSTSLIGEVDASQSGQTVQAFQIGSFLSAQRGGLHTKNSFLDRLNKDEINSVDKLYQATRALTESTLEGMIPEGSDLRLYASALFGDEQGNYAENLYAKRFAKTGVQGASYGEMEESSITSIMKDMYNWFEEGSDAQQRSRIHRLADMLDDKTLMNISNLRDVPEITKAIEKFAKTFVTSMYAADPDLATYSKHMRRAFETMTKMKYLGYQLGKKWGEPMMTYRTPSNENDPHGSKWVDGMTTTMIDKTIPEDYLSALFESNAGISDEYFRSESPITYQTSEPSLDYEAELGKQKYDKDARKFLNDTRSKATTRYPVISIHGLDDLIVSIAISELNRELSQGGGAGLPYVMSVWDAGRVPVLLRGKFGKHYDAAFLKVMQENNFFEMMARGMAENISQGRADMEVIRKKDKPSDAEEGQLKLFGELENAVGNLVHMSKKFNTNRGKFYGKAMLDEKNDMFFDHATTGLNKPMDNIARANARQDPLKPKQQPGALGAKQPSAQDSVLMARILANRKK